MTIVYAVLGIAVGLVVVSGAWLWATSRSD